MGHITIFPGKKIPNWCAGNNPLKSELACSNNGYMDNELGLEFIKSFDHMTERTADLNVPQLLHVDCHGSHITLELLSYARDHNIIIMGYVPHSTHLCQGLDVAVFGAHKVHWAQEREKFE